MNLLIFSTNNSSIKIQKESGRKKFRFSERVYLPKSVKTMLDNSKLIDDKELDFVEKSEEFHVDSQKLLFFLLGNASLLGFNIFINAIDIYSEVIGRSDVGAQINRAYNFPCSLMALFLCIYKPKNVRLIMMVSLFFISLILCLLPLLIIMTFSPSFVYYGTLFLVGLTGIFSSAVFSSSYSISSQFSAESSASVSSGNGCCGVLAAFLRVFTKATFSSKSAMKVSSAAYFYLAAAIIFATLIYFIFKIRNPEIASRVNPKNEESGKEQSMLSYDMKATVKAIYPLWMAVFTNFMITLSLFPGYVIMVPRLKNDESNWTPVIITTMFCVFDWIGRYFPAKIMWPSEKWAWVTPMIRFIFFPLEIMTIQKYVNIGEPLWTIFMMIPFALSNGYFGTVSIIYGSNYSTLTAEQKRFAGLLMSFSVNAGILAAMGLTFVLPTPPK